MINNFKIIKIKDYPDVPAFVITVNFDGEPQSIDIPFDAITNRMEIYDLKSDKEAIIAILKEHYTRKNGGSTWAKHDNGRAKHFYKDMTPAERGAATGATRKDIKVDSVSIKNVSR